MNNTAQNIYNEWRDEARKLRRPAHLHIHSVTKSKAYLFFNHSCLLVGHKHYWRDKDQLAPPIQNRHEITSVSLHIKYVNQLLCLVNWHLEKWSCEI